MRLGRTPRFWRARRQGGESASRRWRLAPAGAALAALSLSGACAFPVSAAPPSTEPPASEPSTTSTTTTQAPATTTMAPTTTITPTTSTTTPPTTTPASTTSTSVPGAGPPFVEFAARADCYFGFPVVRIDATARQETFGGGVNLYLDDSLQRQADVPALADGESWTRLLPAPPSGTVTIEVYFYGGPGGPIDDRWVQIEMAACPLPPTAPTFTTTVEGCAGDDEGATIEVTVTNTPGGPEYGFADQLQHPRQHARRRLLGGAGQREPR